MTTDTQPLLQGSAAPPPYGASELDYRPQNHRHHHIYHQRHYHRHNHHWQHGFSAPFVPQFHPTPVVIQPQILPPVVVIRDRGRPRCRFCKALIIGTVIWFLIGAALSCLRLCCGNRPPYGHPPRWGPAPPQIPHYPIPPEVNLITCEKPLKDGGPAQTSFEIESLDDAILLFSNGTSLYGSVAMTTSTRRDSVKISVNLSSTSNRHADTIVCSLTRLDGGHGVGIFNPTKGPGYSIDVRYDVAVEFPENHPVVKEFETNVINASHDIDDLAGKILFEKLGLHGSNGAIRSRSFSAEWANITTTNGPIEGYFNVSDHLTIVTVNNALDVDVDFHQHRSAEAALTLGTVMAPLKALIKLHDLSPSKNIRASKFQVQTLTVNGRLDVNFQDAPVDSILSYLGLTVNAPAAVALHPTFEGRFSLSTGLPWFIPSVNQHHPDDPTGKGRSRIVNLERRFAGIDGEVHWSGGSSIGKGEVNISTINEIVTLDL